MATLIIDEYADCQVDEIDDDDEAEERRRQMAIYLCARAQDASAWRMADRLALAWDLGGCAEIGIPWSDCG